MFAASSPTTSKIQDLWTDHKMLDLGFFFVWIPVWFVTTLLFWSRRAKRVIAIRSIRIALVQSFVSMISLVFLRIGTLTSAVPCFVELWFVIMSVILWIGCIMLRTVYLYIRVRQNEVALYGLHQGTFSSLDVQPSGQGFKDEFGFAIDVEGDPTRSFQMRPSSSVLSGKQRMQQDAGEVSGIEVCSSGLASVGAGVDAPSSMSRHESLQHSLNQIRRSFTAGNRTVFDKAIQYWLGNEESSQTAFQKLEKAMWLVFLFSLLVTVFSQGFSKTHAFADAGQISYCAMDLDYAFLYALLCLWFCILGPISVKYILRFRKSYVYAYDLLATGFVGIFMALLTTVCGTSRLCEPIQITPRIPLTLMILVSHLTSIIIPLIVSYCADFKFQKLTFDLKVESFRKVLEEEALFHSFKHFAAREMAIEEVLFWETYQDLKFTIEQHIKSTRQKPIQPNVQVSALQMNSIRKPQTSQALMVLGETCADPQPHTEPPLTGPGLSAHQQTNAQQSSINSPHLLTPKTAISASSAVHLSLSRSISVLRASCSVLPADTGELPASIVGKYSAFYLRFICDGSLYQVNLSAATRLALTAKFESGKWNPGDLETAKEEVVHSMYMNLYPRWIEEQKLISVRAG
ncbi:hypothetical protein BJ741DRAFT_592504 [Chytriomyces cf. hyalinus JEL632]|nr:hypothetical protein BJ741DRAFT_592504 [Chytriomyces cf. hyalinus JEL632]